MSKTDFNTEREQYSLGVAIDALKQVYKPLSEKREQLKNQEQNDETDFALHIIDLRMDTLLKVEKNLLEALKEEYAYIERSAGMVGPGDLPKITESRNQKFRSAIMQGLKDVE